MLPRLAAGDSNVTRPLISLIVPSWNDDELVVDLVNGLPVTPEIAEWVVAAVQPGEKLRADIPLMEDLEFSGRLRRLGSTVLLDPPLWSSPRRFRRQGNWLTALLNVAFIALFYFGVDPCTLHRWYYRNFRGSPVQHMRRRSVTAGIVRGK